MSVRISYSDVDIGMAAFGNVQLTIFSGRLQVHHMPIVEALRAEIVAANPDGCFSLVTILPNIRLPAPEARAAGVAMIAKFERTERAVAFVIEGKGVGMSALRTVITTMVLASRTAKPHKVFEQNSQAVPWLAERSTHMGRPLTPADLGTAVLELRTQHLARLQATTPKIA